MLTSLLRESASRHRLASSHRSHIGVIAMLLAGMMFSLLTAPAAVAQNGSFLESLFRSIAEKKLQDELSKRETDRGGRPPAPRPGDFPSGPLGPPIPGSRPPIQPDRPRDDRRPERPQTIRTNSREVGQFAELLIQMDRELASLKDELQDLSRRDAGIRALLPETYQVQALARTVLRQCDGANSLSLLRDPYRSLDQRWRELSFQVRSVPNRSDRLRSIVANCDQTGRKLSRLMKIEPQFDRHGLHDQMIIAATYMQALLDDVETARVPSDQAHDLVHRGRLLREAILEEADRAESVQYDEIVSRFTDFVARWQAYASELAMLRDPVLDRRLARIAQCGDQTYALLWMPPPPRPTPLPGPGYPSPGYPGPVYPGTGFPGGGFPGGGSNQGELSPRTRQTLMSDAASLEGSAEYFRADLKRYARYLTPDSYEREVLRGTDRLYELAKKLHEDLDRRQPLDRLQRTAAELAEVWESLSDEIGHIDSHGLTGRRADSIQQRFEQMLPMVGSLSASLLPTR
tara:strand:- start:810 stop:2360 length:1551 start_codon:yes stop_codon:yes gene_type:complete